MKRSPIYDRYACDETFAYRLNKFVSSTRVCDAMSEEERDFIEYVSGWLIEYQEGRDTKHGRSTPFENDRIVVSQTFALRALMFVDRTIPDNKDEKAEKEYLRSCLNELLEYQISTVTTETEIRYLIINNLI